MQGCINESKRTKVFYLVVLQSAFNLVYHVLSMTVELEMDL